MKGDVAKTAELQRLFDQAKTAFGRIDILVNNAGIYHFQPLDEITERISTATLTPMYSAQRL